MGEQRRNQYNAKMRALSNDNRKLKNEVEELDQKIAQIERNEAERRDHEERKHKEEVEMLKKMNAQRKEQLESMLPRNRWQCLDVGYCLYDSNHLHGLPSNSWT